MEVCWSSKGVGLWVVQIQTLKFSSGNDAVLGHVQKEGHFKVISHMSHKCMKGGGIIHLDLVPANPACKFEVGNH